MKNLSQLNPKKTPCWAAFLLLLFVSQTAMADDNVKEFERRFKKDLPEIEVPPGATTAWIAKKMLRNGLPMSIRGFATSDSTDEVATFFMHEWRKKALSPVREEFKNGRKTVGVLKGDYYVTVQTFPSRRGSEGFIVVSKDPQSSTPTKSTKLPLPHSLRVVTKDEYLDSGIVAESLTAVSDRSIRIESRELSRRLRREGWSEVEGVSDRRSLDINMMEFQNNSQHIQVTLRADRNAQQTVMLLHWRKN
jgi:hypothetical protein